MPILTFKGWSEFALGLAGLEVSWKGVSYHIKHRNCKLRTILDISWLEWDQPENTNLPKRRSSSDPFLTAPLAPQPMQ